MSTSSPIEFDVTILYSFAARRAVRASLARTHGAGFADAFATEYSMAVERAVRLRLHGRNLTSLVLEVKALKAICHPDSEGLHA